MAYIELFTRVAEYVRSKGLRVRFRRGKPVSTPSLARVSARLLVPIPATMAEFYMEVGDGLEFAWIAKGDRAPFANHVFPSLSELAEDMQQRAACQEQWRDYDFRYTDNPTLARKTAAKMRKWMPFHDEGSGDMFCLDSAVEPAPVVFDQHDWFDGGSGENGHVMAISLLEFYRNWATVSLQFFRSLAWWRVFPETGAGVNWHHDEFSGEFRCSL